MDKYVSEIGYVLQLATPYYEELTVRLVHVTNNTYINTYTFYDLQREFDFICSHETAWFYVLERKI